MSFNALNQLTLSFFLILSIFAGLGIGYKDSYLVSCAAILYICFLLFSSTIQLTNTKPLLIYFIFLSILWCLLRIVYLQFSIDSLNYTYLVNLTPNEIAISITLLTVSSLFFLLGLATGDKKNITKVFPYSNFIFTSKREFFINIFCLYPFVCPSRLFFSLGWNCK